MIIILYSGTVVLCTILEVINNLKLMKELGNRGYKLNSKFLSKSKAILLIPFINIVSTIKKKYFFKEIIKRSDEDICKEHLIIPFTPLECRSYNRNHSIWNIIKLNISNNMNPNSILIYMKNGYENIIYYTKINKQIIIVSTKGEISYKSIDEQYKELDKEISEINSVYIGSKSSASNSSVEKMEKDYSKVYNYSYVFEQKNDKHKVYVKKYVK